MIKHTEKNISSNKFELFYPVSRGGGTFRVGILNSWPMPTDTGQIAATEAIGRFCS
jgi:hypothetical protein